MDVLHVHVGVQIEVDEHGLALLVDPAEHPERLRRAEGDKQPDQVLHASRRKKMDCLQRLQTSTRAAAQGHGVSNPMDGL